LLDFAPGQLHGTAFQQRLQSADGNIIPWETGVLKQLDQPGRALRLNDAALLNAGNEAVAVRVSAAPLPPPHKGFVVVFLDNRSAKILQNQLEQLVVTDPLTTLLNRAGFLNVLTTAVERGHRDQYSLAVMYLDLDGFKHVNDSMGHAQGDLLLRRVAERLRDALRTSDTLARIGGDEFTILLDRLQTVDDTARIAEKILTVVETPVMIDMNEVIVSASIGIATFPDCGDNVETLMKAADIAMYQAKSDGRSQYRFFTQEMNGRARARFMLQESLRSAINTKEFFLQYQPQIALRDGRLRGFEALLRWQHKRAGLVAPAVFIPLLEETLLINQVGTWVAAEACAASKRLDQSPHQSLTMSINLSARQFNNRDLVAQLLRLLNSIKCRPHNSRSK